MSVLAFERSEKTNTLNRIVRLVVMDVRRKDPKRRLRGGLHLTRHSGFFLTAISFGGRRRVEHHSRKGYAQLGADRQARTADGP